MATYKKNVSKQRKMKKREEQKQGIKIEHHQRDLNPEEGNIEQLTEHRPEELELEGKKKGWNNVDNVQINCCKKIILSSRG